MCHEGLTRRRYIKVSKRINESFLFTHPLRWGDGTGPHRRWRSRGLSGVRTCRRPPCWWWGPSTLPHTGTESTSARNHSLHKKQNSTVFSPLKNVQYRYPMASAADPESDPDLLAGSRFGKKHSGAEQLQIRNEFEIKLLWKTDQIWQFSLQNYSFKKNINSFFAKKYYLKSLYLVIICNLTLTKTGIQR